MTETSRIEGEQPSTAATKRFKSVEICAGGGGLALGLESAGFDPVVLIDDHLVACETLRLNRPGWDVLEADLRTFDPSLHQQTYDVDLLSAGLPRVKGAAGASRANGSDPELELIRATIFLVHGMQPRALVLENMPDLVTKPAFEPIRQFVRDELVHLGYDLRWFVLNAADFGVPQDRRQGFLVALKGDAIYAFDAPVGLATKSTVGEALSRSMGSRGWRGAAEWAAQADRVAPTVVGGSWKRGGADLGPTGTKRAWARIGVNGRSLADQVPGPDFHFDPSADLSGFVKLTLEQVATLQGFPPDWQFAGRKTARYRQIGNASPPPVSRAVGLALRAALEAC
ncbi:DNA (cytosine-5)-methyltransferase 1 [Kribbella amoyensis]|uniref:DNA (cytosine-5-)-methyltransferase n=1 Tax=Kribbella amoyensis TaxID=996641 RepID=A0A561B2R1_9ACTN|nr:DNA cytosine methyltransferase [Kribbella amoyensis]TWD73147.1 DNA (cytosine-5)-methyltransferase 1 [Kribbella amoyensis]